MKIKRHKHTKRVLNFYKTNFKFDTKYFNVIVDGTFAHEALNCKINLAEQMPKFFETDKKTGKKSKCHLFTTKCAIKETEMLGKVTRGAMLILKQYDLVECKHKREYVSSEKCIKSIVLESMNDKQTFARRYVVATQSDSLKDTVRSIPGVPLLIISHNSINMEKPSEMSAQKATDALNLKLSGPKLIKQDKPNEDAQKVVVVHRKRKAKGPNPLSCKKKQKKPSTNKVKSEISVNK